MTHFVVVAVVVRLIKMLLLEGFDLGRLQRCLYCCCLNMYFLFGDDDE